MSSAGLPSNRAVAWVEVSVPEMITTPAGVAFRQNLLACTSFDGSLATIYKRTVQLTVCDNTMSAALGERGQTVKVKHSAHSLTRIGDVRQALAMVHQTAEVFTESVQRLVDAPVRDVQFRQVLEALVPVAPDATPRERSIGEDNRHTLIRLYRWDPRVAAWTGTGFGVIQAFNTWHRHV